tara:strand:+ start:4560 stop:4997 length:438 start_codon:yes stop_codon:yes gene_type:complete
MNEKKYGNENYTPSMRLSGVCESLGIIGKAFGDGACSVTCQVSENHLNAGGVAHGGLHSAMLDTALGGALVSLIKKEEWCATAQLDISFLNAANVGDILVAEGKVLRRGKNLAHCDGILSNQHGKTIATAKGTWAIWESKPSSMR